MSAIASDTDDAIRQHSTIFLLNLRCTKFKAKDFKAFVIVLFFTLRIIFYVLCCFWHICNTNKIIDLLDLILEKNIKFLDVNVKYT